MSRVYFIDLPNRKKNTASYNRFLHIVEMASLHFDTKIIKAKDTPPFVSRYRFLRGICIRLNMILALLQVVKEDKEFNKSVLYVFGIDPVLSLIYFIILKKHKLKYICERNEYPVEIIKSNNLLIFIKSIFIYKWYFKLYDGFTVISESLKAYYSKYKRKESLVYVLPMCVDFERFEEIKSNDLEYLFYAGSLDNNKDGIDYLLEAFSKIAEEYKDVSLIIAGGCKKKRRVAIDEFIHNNKLQDRVKLLGLIDREDIPYWLVNSKINILARPISKQAEGGFPTKLGEYLAAGRPTIVTRVGEMVSYLNEDEVFFISPNDIKCELIKKIKFILSNGKISQDVAMRGHKAAKQKFDILQNSLIVKKIINELTQKETR